MRRTKRPSVEHRAHCWIVSDDTGESAKAIWAHMTGVAKPPRHCSYPLDAYDLGRCLRLLNLIPEWRQRLHHMAMVSKEWRRLIKHWDLMEAVMRQEVGIDWSKGERAPRTYVLMGAVLEGKRIRKRDWLKEKAS